ncbi:MAG TPA: vWA domain-containing protein [Pirellulales bacterium]|jgi:hypothetical protein
MKSNGALRNWLESVPIERDGVSWAVSLGVHLALLLLLALIWQSLPDRPVGATLSAWSANDAVNLQEVQYSESTSETDEVGANSLQGTGMAQATAPSLGEISNLETGQMAASDTGPSELPVMVELSTAPNLSDRLAVRGDAGVGVKGAEGAVDRVTQEIMESLDERPTLVVWLMDQSESLRPQRAAIEQRFDHVYRELGIIQSRGNDAFTKHGNQPLLTTVIGFGQEINLRIKEPTDDLAEIKKAIHELPVDESGVELTFTAVAEAARKFQKFRPGGTRRNVMFIVVTDEAGNDEDRLETAIELCKKHAIPVYAIGVPAPFGQRQAYVRYVPTDPQFRETDVAVDTGPESAMPENVQIGFSGRDWNKHIAIDSGFGPYGLTRLCVATHGIYFAVHPNRPAKPGHVNETAAMVTRINQFFDPEVMRNYKPDYVAPRQYDQLLKENHARTALVQAAEFSMVDPMDRPRFEFPKRNEAQLKQELDVAQRAAAIVAPKLQQLYTILKAGEKDRAKLTGSRWQAGYDLAMGRVLAVMVRTDTYNAILGKAKNGMKFEKEDSDTWVLEPSDDITASSQYEKFAAQARENLTRVRDKHPGTPWAYLAEKELSEPLGWKWTEKHTGFEERERMARNGGGGGGNPQDQLRKLEKPKPVPTNVKL